MGEPEEKGPLRIPSIEEEIQRQSEKDPVYVVPDNGRGEPAGSLMVLASHGHVHLDSGKCIKNRYGKRCKRG